LRQYSLFLVSINEGLRLSYSAASSAVSAFSFSLAICSKLAAVILSFSSLINLVNPISSSNDKIN
jgi:hypothetical protein